MAIGNGTKKATKNRESPDFIRISRYSAIAYDRL